MHAWDDADGALLDDRYEVGSRLGRSGAAVVHRAWDRDRDREVAVTLLPPAPHAAPTTAAHAAPPPTTAAHR